MLCQTRCHDDICLQYPLYLASLESLPRVDPVEVSSSGLSIACAQDVFRLALLLSCHPSRLLVYL